MFVWQKDDRIIMAYSDKNLKKIKYKGGKEINNCMLNDHSANLYRLSKQIKLLKKDLERDCKAYWKYDELCDRIIEMQKAIIIEDELNNG